MKDRRGAYRVLVRDLKERCRKEHLGVNGRKMLKRILKERDGGTDCDSSAFYFVVYMSINQ